MPAANEYVQAYEAYIEDFRTAYLRMMKNADLSDYSHILARAQELKVKGEEIAQELEPSEREAFGRYLDQKAEELGRIMHETL